MTVYIVLEEDRGIGVMVSGVYATEAKAQAMCGGHEWVAEAMFDDAIIRKECADRAVACFFSTMAESGLSTGNDYAVLVISDKLRAAIEGGQPKPLPVEVLAVASQDKLHIDIGTRKPVRAKKRGQP